MKKITFDSGIQEYRLGSGVLRFNPADPNLYSRFLEAADKLTEITDQLTRDGQATDGAQVISLLCQADSRIKTLLSWVFGGDNDFHALLDGVNLLAQTGSGSRVIQNLLAALEPILTDGARRCAQAQADMAVAQAKARRAAR